MSAVMRKTLKPCCSAMPGWLDRLRPDALGDSAAWIPVQRRRGSTRKRESALVSDNTKMIRVQGWTSRSAVGDQQPEPALHRARNAKAVRFPHANSRYAADPF